MKKYLVLILCLLLLTGCTNKQDERIVNVLNWSSYIPDEVIKDFEKEYNIKVNYGTYSSNEELLAKLSSSKEGTYDVVFPSDYMVELMIQKDMLKELDKSRFNNFNNINTIFLNQEYDREKLLFYRFRTLSYWYCFLCCSISECRNSHWNYG